MYKIGEVDMTTEGDIVIHGDHFSKEEAQQLLSEQGYSEKVVSVEHGWATWGFVPDDIFGDGEKHNGWWIIAPHEKYKHKKKMTLVTID
jgi:hypothetical protein